MASRARARRSLDGPLPPVALGLASRARARRSRHSPCAQVPADLLTASMTLRVLVMVSAAGRSERESAAKALICADMNLTDRKSVV